MEIRGCYKNLKSLYSFSGSVSVNHSEHSKYRSERVIQSWKAIALQDDKKPHFSTYTTFVLWLLLLSKPPFPPAYFAMSVYMASPATKIPEKNHNLFFLYLVIGIAVVARLISVK